MGERGTGGGAAWDRARLAESEKAFWEGFWDAPVIDTLYDVGADMVGFGPLRAACVTDEPDEPGLNFILGAGEAGAVEHGHLADAVEFLESRCLEYGAQGVDYRVPVVPGLPEATAAEEWLQSQGGRREEGPAKLVRDAAPPRFASPPGIEVLDWTEWDEGFGDPLAESLGLPGVASIFFLCLLDDEDWRCYCAADTGGEGPLAYVAMHVHSNVAAFALASRPYEGRDGEGQMAILHRCILDAAAAGCDMLVVVDAGGEPPAVDRDSLIRAGFEVAYRAPTWRSRARVAG